MTQTLMPQAAPVHLGTALAPAPALEGLGPAGDRGRPSHRGRPRSGEPTGEPAKPRTSRIATLDGLRGVAAIVVLLNHLLVACVPVLANTYLGTPPPKPGTGVWWVAFTPVRIFWAGPEAVVLFFILSGYVLALPAVRKGARWLDGAYYPRRVLRLYLPVWVAILFAAGIHLVVSRSPVHGASWWLNAHATPMHLRDLLRTADLVRSSNPWEFTSVLWSLKWEVLFSMALPLALVFPVATRRHPWLAAGGVLVCLVSIFEGAGHNNAYFHLLPMFVIGSILAFHTDRVRVRAVRTRQALTTGSLWAMGLLILLAMTAGYWMLLPQLHLLVLGPYPIYAMSRVAAAVGSVAVICCSLVLPGWRRVLECRPIQWVGTRSCSIYFVHEPIVVTVGFLMRARPIPLYILIGGAASLAAADIFWRVVERPGLTAARWFGEVAKWSLRATFLAPAVAPQRRP